MLLSVGMGPASFSRGLALEGDVYAAAGFRLRLTLAIESQQVVPG